MRNPTTSPVTACVPHGRARHPCSPHPQDRANESMPSLSGPRRRGIPRVIPWRRGIRSILASHALAPRAALRWRVDLGADVHPLSGRIRVGVPCRSIALGEMRDASGPARDGVVGCGFSMRTSASRVTPEPSSSPPGGSAQCQPPGARVRCDLNQEG